MFKIKDCDNFGIGLVGIVGLVKYIMRWWRDGMGMLIIFFVEGVVFFKLSFILDWLDL